MKDIKDLYIKHCVEFGIPFQSEELTVSPYNESTLFCPAGIQQYGHLVKGDYKITIANIQPSIRLNDLDEIGDGSHLLYFNMLGLFSFRELSLKKAVEFWITFLLEKLELKLSKITVHPDKKEWKDILYKNYPDENIVEDIECIWSDGISEGYCTEFYVMYKGKELEIGNIVNPNGDCIDFGGGLERLRMVVNNIAFTKEQTLIQTINELLKANYLPSNKQQGYVTRKLIRLLVKAIPGVKDVTLGSKGISFIYEFLLSYNPIPSFYKSIYEEEILKYLKAKEFYLSNKDKYKYRDKDSNFWWESFGFKPEEFD